MFSSTQDIIGHPSRASSFTLSALKRFIHLNVLYFYRFRIGSISGPFFSSFTRNLILCSVKTDTHTPFRQKIQKTTLTIINTKNCILVTNSANGLKMDWNELKILIHFNSFEQNMDWKNSIYIISILSWIKMNCMTPSNFFLDLKNRNHFVLISCDKLKWINGLHIFLIEKNKNRFVFIPSCGLKWILKNSEILIG